MKKVIYAILALLFLINLQTSCSSFKKEPLVQYFIDKKNNIIDQNPSMLIYKTLEEEIQQHELQYEGEIPQWLNGTLLRVGPAKFETNTQIANHLFDGFGMVYAFDFMSGKITYSNKFIESEYYKHALKTGEIIHGFSRGQEKNFLCRALSFISSLIFGKVPYDNANVNVAKIGNHYVTLTETPFVIELDGKTAKTQGHFDFNDQITGDVTTAHPIVDPSTGEMFNYITQYGRHSYYHIYKIANNSTKREIIASVLAEKPSYMHSFALTKDYIILTQNPFTVNPLTLLISSKAFIDNFVWEPETGTTFTVINRHTGEIIGNFKTQAFFTFHHVNAYQNESSIIVDLVEHDFDDAIIKKLSFEEIFGLEKNFEQTNRSYLARYSIDLTNKRVNYSKLSNTSIEMPTINETISRTNEHHYVYGISSSSTSQRYGSALVKINTETGQPLYWINDACTAGEPVFVANPNGCSEDDGILLSVVLDHIEKKSFLLILDAKTLKEHARAYVPHHIPFGLHGNFFSN